MGKALSSFLRVEPFAALFCLSALYLPPLDPPACWQLSAVQLDSMSFYGNAASTDKSHYFAHLRDVNLLFAYTLAKLLLFYATL